MCLVSQVQRPLYNYDINNLVESYGKYYLGIYMEHLSEVFLQTSPDATTVVSM